MLAGQSQASNHPACEFRGNAYYSPTSKVYQTPPRQQQVEFAFCCLKMRHGEARTEWSWRGARKTHTEYARDRAALVDKQAVEARSVRAAQGQAGHLEGQIHL